MKDGIEVVQQSSRIKKILPKNVVAEALLMSEMFDLNELVAMELIVTGESQVPRYPGAARGPVAVMLYYDAKRSLLSSLKCLLQAVSGKSWSINLPRDFNRLLSTFLGELVDDGIVDRVLDTLSNFDAKSEFDLLHRNRALGPGKFKRQVYDLIKEIKDLYSYIVFAFAAQFDLKEETISHLIKTAASKGSLDSNRRLDSTTVMLVFGIFYVLDVPKLHSINPNTSVTRGDSGQQIDNPNLPQIIKDKQLLKNISSSLDSTQFSVPEVKVMISFCLGLTVRAINTSESNHDSIVASLDEEKLIDESIGDKVFEILDSMIVKNTVVESDEFFMLRIHTMLIDMPHLFPIKMKELRDRGDEEGRIVASNIQQGINPPASLRHNFQKYLNLLANFYSKDKKGLSTNFWKTSEILLRTNAPENNISFFRFLKSSLETYLPQNLRLVLFKLLASFAKTSPFNVFGLLRSGNLHNPQYSFEEIFGSFDLYLRSFKDVSNDFGSSYSTLMHNTSSQQSQKLVITAMDIEVLCAILDMIESIVSSDKTCSISIAENQSYNCIPVFVGLTSCPIPRRLKAALLSCLGGFCKASPSVALNVWSKLDIIIPKPQVAVTLHSQASIGGPRNWTDGVFMEVEDIEPRSEEYPVTIGFLKCINDVVDHVINIKDSTKQAVLETATNFVINGILLKVHSRVFAVEEEKWKIILHCLEITKQVLNAYNPIDDETLLKSSFLVMNQVLQENLLFRTLMCVIEDVASTLLTETSSQVVHPPHFDNALHQLHVKCLHRSLQIIFQVIDKQNDFMNLVRSVPGYPYASLMSMATLFANINPRTTEADRLATLIKLSLIAVSEVRTETMKILRGLVSEDATISHLCLLQVQPLKLIHEDYIFHGFVDSIESGNEKLRLEVLKLISECFQTDFNATSSGYGLANKLLGLDRKLQLRTPGSLDQTYTCLHSIIASIEGELDATSSEEQYWSMQIILLMCTHPLTRSNTLRFLRTSYELVANYLRLQVKMNAQEFDKLAPKTPLFWKLLAAELKTVTDSCLKSYANTYIRLLLGPDGDKKLLDIIPRSVFTHSYPEMPSWEYFDGKELWNTISSCSEDGVVDVKSLHQNILHEVRQFSSQLGASQAGSIQNEIRSILSFACDLNASKKELDLKIMYLEGWRDLMEIILLTNSLDVFEGKTRGNLVLQLLNELLALASSPETITSLLSPISSVITIAAVTLRKMPSETVSKSNMLTSARYLTNVLESPASAETWNQMKRARVNLYTSLLHFIRSLEATREQKLSNRLLDRLVKDSLTGVELVKVLALSILTECDSSWVGELASDGSLRMLIHSILNDDKEIKESKCDKLSKAFYSFEAKMTLLIGIASSQSGARTLIHLGITECLLSLETFDIYTNSTNKNEVCFRIFTSVLKLILLLVDMSIPSDLEILAKFLTCKSHIFYDLMRSPSESYRESEEGKIIIPQLVSLTSKLILFTDSQLQKSFIQSTYICHDIKSSVDLRILTSVLQGCIRFMTQNRKYNLLNLI